MRYPWYSWVQDDGQVSRAQQFLVLKYSTLHMGHYVDGLSEEVHYLVLQSDIQSHTDMLDYFQFQQCR